MRRNIILTLLAMILPAALLSLRANSRTLSSDDQQRVIDRIVQELDAKYVFPEMGTQMVKALREKSASGRYKDITDAVAFATALTADLQGVSHDKHLNIVYGPARQVPQGGTQGAPAVTIEPVKILAGNVGYIKIN